MDTQRVPYQPGVLLGWGQLSVGVPRIIFFLLSVLKRATMTQKKKNYLEFKTMLTKQ